MHIYSVSDCKTFSNVFCSDRKVMLICSLHILMDTLYFFEKTHSRALNLPFKDTDVKIE